MYGTLPLSDIEDDRADGPTPSDSLSPAPSSSPMPFLPRVESTFTPLSMDSDLYSAPSNIDHTAADTPTSSVKGEDVVAFAARAKGRAAVSSMARSPPSAPATASADHPLVLPPSSGLGTNSTADPSPQPNNPDSGHVGAPDAERNFTSKFVSASSASKTTVASTLGAIEEDPHPHVVTEKPLLVKPKPIVRTASTKSVSLRHPAPDLTPRSATHATNIAQLEATAEKLSMTSSIEDAIRDLHDEQKRADSRRSSILAASIASIPEADEPVSFPLLKSVSAANSIRETNNAARYGGYSPAGYVMSPDSSIASGPTRLRSGSTGSLSRHGPGTSSVRSVRSATKPVLTNIAEIETSLNAAAMDEADRLAENHEEDEHLHMPHLYDVDLTPNANGYNTSSANDYWNQAVEESQREFEYKGAGRVASPGSEGTFEQAERAFADFDGAHCSPDVDLEESLNFQALFASAPAMPPSSHLNELEHEADENEADNARPIISRPLGLPTVRPKSYLDPETGDTMMYYPARVPMMLNLPQKLSKRPKAEVRNIRRSQVLSAMPEADRNSTATLLPDITFEALLPLGAMGDHSDPEATANPMDHRSERSANTQDERQSPTDAYHPLAEEDRRKSRMSMLTMDKRMSQTMDKRMSQTMDKRMSQIPDLGQLPPQLRASAFFDLPASELPTIQLKDGSATNTLDDILNASAKAPVTAFTDHAFAGSLGNETYGADKKRKSHMKRASAAELSVPKTRRSIFHIRKISGLSRPSTSSEKHHEAVEDEERQHLSGSVDGKAAPEGEEEEPESDNEPVYNGPPTTLLAELQMRKQQQKLRTRPPATAFPNGMHSTLLEMDTVAELERRARKGKRINLAWEDPSSKQAGDDDDEDVPLGLLAANKGQKGGLINAIAEVNRPIGLMERRDMEDNEPLSVRRNRLQGLEAGPIQRIALTRGVTAPGALGPPSPQLRVITPEGDEEEGETLGARLRRLRAQKDENSLPQARPVSSAFSAELLSQFGDALKDEEKSENKKSASPVQPSEEEETLGQRRKRLQEEREARERELARIQLTGGRTTVSPQLVKRHSLADVLGTYNRQKMVDPRAEADRVKQEEAVRYQRDQEQKLAIYRNQVPTNLSAPNLVKPGGFMAGRFNDGNGGGFGQSRSSVTVNAFSGQSGLPNPAANASMLGNAFRAGGAMSGYAMANPYGSTYAAPSQTQVGQMDRVERWRQGVSP
ncbi:hypothetical protein GGR57DRAFT_82472 [Xylariaceae sp. FL1272]|nr:hypothetical protein GGR57DRAFT_82472 [Xylariaceae sp. FL1272]